MPSAPQDDLNKDLGLGSRVTQQSGLRFLNKDGSFNVRRKGFTFFRSLNLYHWMLTISWTRFNLMMVLAYFFTNIVFAFGYFLCGADALHGSSAAGDGGHFLEAFFFSVQTLATIGYGSMSPSGLAANLLVTCEAFFGLLGFALATGLLFARFSRPTAQIAFSRNAVVAPYRNITAFEFRLANERTNELIEVNATVVLARNEGRGTETVRKFHTLRLERPQVVFLPLHWVVVHPIDDTSPLFGIDKEQLAASDAEFLILLTAVDETFSQTVHARTSYKCHEVVWGARFSDMFQRSDDGALSIDLRDIHDIEPTA
jgi:inward rectifier potassium channel